jgi:capsular polysaccharide transport system permease protein
VHNLFPHFRIVLAFIIREIASRYGKSSGGYLWAVVEPVAYFGMMSFLFGSLARMPAMGTPFPLCFATGYTGYSMYKTMAGYLSSAISANRSLLQYPVVAQIDPFISRAILQAAITVMVAIIILWAAHLTEPHPYEVLWTALNEAISFAPILAFEVALTNVVLFERFNLYEKVFGIITSPLFLLSGVFYVPGQMPHPFQDFLLANPITQIIILFREGFYSASVTNGFNMAYLFWWVLPVAFISLFTFTI